MPILTASLRTPRTTAEINAERNAVRSGGWYCFEVAYPQEQRPTLDPAQTINGCRMTVATMTLYVHNVICCGDRIEFVCTGRDRYNNPADGSYFYYQSPIYMRGDRPFVLSVTPA
ncbi:MAG: hypothetical protein IKN66_13930 [Ruminococcus sp.]|nr:hypothetical protein [Ruminococcus sp.]